MAKDSYPAHLTITALRWYTLRDGTCIGFVAVVDGVVPQWKVYIGLGSGENEFADAKRIADQGTPILDEHLARALAGERWKDLPYAL